MAIANTARWAAALSIAAALTGCGQGRHQAAAPAPPSVTVANPVQRTVVDQDEYVGRFVAVDSVDVRARVSGYLTEIHFTDGQMVKKGDLLFVIDHRALQRLGHGYRRRLCCALLLSAVASGQSEQQHGRRRQDGETRRINEFHRASLERLGIIGIGPCQSHETHGRRANALAALRPWPG